MPAPSTWIGALVAIAILVGLYLWYRFTPQEKDREKAAKFLNDLSNHIETILTRVVTTIDIKNYSTLEELELAIFRCANEETWKFVSVQLESAIENKAISSLVASLITQERVEELIKTLLTKSNLMMVAGSRWNEKLEETFDEAEELEKKTAERNKQLRTGTVPDVDEKNFVPPEYNPEPVNGSIIPPSEEENPVKDDGSVELVDDSTETDTLPEDVENQ